MAYIEAENLQKTFKVYERPKGAGAALRSLIHRTYTEKRAVDGISFSSKRGNGGIYRAKRGREIHYD